MVFPSYYNLKPLRVSICNFLKGRIYFGRFYKRLREGLDKDARISISVLATSLDTTANIVISTTPNVITVLNIICISFIEIILRIMKSIKNTVNKFDKLEFE